MTRVRHSVAWSVRRIVLLTLSPAPMIACSSAAGGSSDASLPEAPEGPIGQDAPSDADGLGESAAETCDASAYDDGGAGTCSPHWIQGDGCNGGAVLFPCGLPDAPLSTSTQGSYGLCSTYCMASDYFNGCQLRTADGGPGAPITSFIADAGTAPTVVNCYFDHTGRRPVTLVGEPRGEARTVGDALARIAYLEAASVEAFADLAEQLESHAAPGSLVRRLREAAMDEVRHARTIGRLACVRGRRPPAVRCRDAEARGLFAIALENAREGCVRETWGAACAIVQSQRASDPELREAMRLIARDELRHAVLSWDVAEWIAARLTNEERDCVDAERSSAIVQLQGELEHTLPKDLARVLGFPTRDEARAIVSRMRVDVWREAA
jgi:tRNA isopentenyl-2-thiomethyl-A-37 hydroxylase MiaE